MRFLVLSLLALSACDPKPSPLAQGTSAQPAASRSLPPVDDACSADADCVLFEGEIADAPPRTYACCAGCTQRALSRASVAKFRAACDAAPATPCPPLGCAMPLMRAVCENGRCAAKSATPATSATAERPDEHGMPETISLPTVEAICKKASCSGAMAHVTAWYDARSAITLYVHDGDIRTCSHPPTTYFDRNATEVGVIPMKPVVRGSPEDTKLRELRERLTNGLTKGGDQYCPKR